MLLFELDGAEFMESRKERKDRQLVQNSSNQKLELEVQSDFWYPLTAFDVWPSFVRSMMTVLNEHVSQNKYNHLLLVEYYEFLGRIAFTY